MLDWDVATSSAAVPGVVEVNTFGGELKTYQVALDPERLAALGLWRSGTSSTPCGANNRNVGGGYIEHEGEQFLIRGEALVDDLDDIASVVLANDARGDAGHDRATSPRSSSRR